MSRGSRYQDVSRLIRKFYLNLLLERDHANMAQVVRHIASLSTVKLFWTPTSEGTQSVLLLLTVSAFIKHQRKSYLRL